jgi:hypothetical protein
MRLISLLAALAAAPILVGTTACSTAEVVERQSKVTETYNKMLDNSAARIEARDARFDAERDLILQ